MIKNPLSLFFVMLALLMSQQSIAQDATSIDGKLIFQDEHLIDGRPMDVYYHIPQNYTVDSKVLFVLHGNARNPEVYRKQWVNYSEKYNVLLIVPGFSRDLFPKDQDYNMGNMFDMNKNDEILSIKPKEKWSFSTIEPIFDLIVKKFKNNSEGYYIFGHSAGSQFVHRFFTFVPEARILKAVFGNAGWYTMPDFDKRFPYGLKETTASLDRLEDMFKKNIVVLLGTADTVKTHKSLRVTPEAMEQGAFRLERGKNYYQMAAKLAADNNFDFNWKLRFAQGVGHKNKYMAEFASKFMFETETE